MGIWITLLRRVPFQAVNKLSPNVVSFGAIKDLDKHKTSYDTAVGELPGRARLASFIAADTDSGQIMATKG